MEPVRVAARYEAREQRIAAQLAERKRYEDSKAKRKMTYEELVELCARE